MPTRDEVRGMLPELELIEDEKLREKTLDVWIDAMETGGWEVVDMKDIPFTLLIENTDLTLLDHTRVGHADRHRDRRHDVGLLREPDAHQPRLPHLGRHPPRRGQAGRVPAGWATRSSRARWART